MSWSADVPNDLSATRPNWPPQPVVDLAIRLGARTDGTVIRLTQHGTMRSGATALSLKFSAEQTIQLRQPGFEWRASTGPAGCITVLPSMAKSPNFRDQNDPRSAEFCSLRPSPSDIGIF
jgi:hypothetical protein